MEEVIYLFDECEEGSKRELTYQLGNPKTGNITSIKELRLSGKKDEDIIKNLSASFPNKKFNFITSNKKHIPYFLEIGNVISLQNNLSKSVKSELLREYLDNEQVKNTGLLKVINKNNSRIKDRRISLRKKLINLLKSRINKLKI